MLRTAILTALITLALAVPASADVLVTALPKRPVCGSAINPGIWAQPWTTGSRTVRMRAIDDRSGRVWWRKTAVAYKTRWRDWLLPSGMNGQCRPTTFVYNGPGWTIRYRIRFRSEGV